MVSSRKRKRSSIHATSAGDYGGTDPPPFAPAQLSLLKSYRGPLPRSLTSGLSPLVLNLIIAVGERLKARDFASAAAALPALLKRYRKVKSQRWFFSREIAVSGAEILRRSGGEYAELLDEFLAHIGRDAHLATRSGFEGYAVRTRESVLLERVMELLAVSNLKNAFDCLYEQSQEPTFKSSALVQGYLGVVAIAASTKEPDPSIMLRVASSSLNAASELEPKAYFYVYYAAAAALAAGRGEEALRLLRDFVSTKYRTDPIALFGLLSCLEGLEGRDSGEIRQERIEIARRLLKVDPLSKAGLDTLREAHSWSWQVSPIIDNLEMAEAFGSRIEHGDMGNTGTWMELGHVLAYGEPERKVFWNLSGRCDWWPSHFFRSSRFNADLMTDPSLPPVKGAVAKMLSSLDPCPYTEAAIASGLVKLHDFGYGRR